MLSFTIMITRSNQLMYVLICLEILNLGIIMKVLYMSSLVVMLFVMSLQVMESLIIMTLMMVNIFNWFNNLSWAWVNLNLF